MSGLGGTDTSATGINNRGVVTGTAWTLNNAVYHPFVYHNGSTLELMPLGESAYAGATDINMERYVAGRTDGSGLDARATLWTPEGKPVDMGNLGGSMTTAAEINNLLQAVGYGETAEGDTHAFMWMRGDMTDLGTLSGDHSKAYSLNNNGITVGLSWLEGNFVFAACYWEDGVIHELPGLGGEFSRAFGVNDHNQIVGYARPQYGNRTPVVWQQRWIRRLRYPNSSGAEAHGINNNGVIIGSMEKGSWSEYSTEIVWPSPDYMAVSVYKLLPPNSRWGYIANLSDINDLNQIVGSGNYGPNDDVFNRHAFLLTPVYPSFDLTQFSPGISGQMSTIEAHNVPPGATVHFLGARWGGGALIPTCEVTKNALQLEDPRQLGTAVADEGGVAVIEGLIPDEWAGREILFQAFIRDSCEISNLVVQTFE
ncbi:MAG: hypothetical protein HND57_09665 [Planctomycetes bacterium]|nr:hypothetical protein [Planctomycetota bacterium]